MICRLLQPCPRTLARFERALKSRPVEYALGAKALAISEREQLNGEQVH